MENDSFESTVIGLSCVPGKNLLPHPLPVKSARPKIGDCTSEESRQLLAISRQPIAEGRRPSPIWDPVSPPRMKPNRPALAGSRREELLQERKDVAESLVDFRNAALHPAL